MSLLWLLSVRASGGSVEMGRWWLPLLGGWLRSLITPNLEDAGKKANEPAVKRYLRELGESG